MFTGIVEEMGAVRSLGPAQLGIDASLVMEGISIGDSIAVNGCCLTVVEIGDGFWLADVSEETLSRTTMGELEVGDLVNLERPVPLGGRLGGHLVQGHVDVAGVITTQAPNMAVSVPFELARYIVEKGSVAVDGVSLTAVEIKREGTRAIFTTALIPFTCKATSLGVRKVGDKVNIEVDLMAKYAENLLSSSFTTAAFGGETSGGEISGAETSGAETSGGTES